MKQRFGVVVAASLLLVTILLFASSAFGARELYDEEEFEGFEVPSSEAQHVIEEEERFDDQPSAHEQQTQQQPQQQQQQKQEQKPAVSEQEKQRRLLAQDLTVDYIYGLVLVIYAINFFYGRKRNAQLAASWAKQADSVISETFTHSSGVKKESQYQYKLTASGRPGVLGLQANLVLKKRHDLFSLLIGLVSSTPDLLTIEVLMQQDQVDPFVLALVKPKEEKSYKKDNNDLNTMTKKIEVKSLSNNFAVLAEAEELGYAIFKDVIPILNKQHAFVKCIHFTDQSTVYAKSPVLVKFEFVIPPENQMKKITSLMNMAIYLLDHSSKLKIGRHGRMAIDGNRRKLHEQKQKALRVQREEAAQKRKLEKKQQDQKKLESLSPEEQRKLEEKNYKKSLRKKASKLKVVYG